MGNKPGAIIIEGHIQGLSNTRSLGEIGIPVYVVDKHDCIARYSMFCTKYFRCPEYIDDTFADFLVELANKEKIKGWVLIPSNDHAVITISRHRKRLEEHFKLTTPSLEIVESLYDKSKLLQTAFKKNIDIPATFYFKNENDTIPSNLKFPVLTKGRYGLAFYRTFRKKAFVAENEAQLKLQLRKIAEKCPVDSTFTQEIIPDTGFNKTISFTAFCANGEIKSYWMGRKLREHPVKFGTATFSESVLEDIILQLSTLLLKELKYSGVCEVEYLKDPRDGKFKLIEINARTWLWVGLAKACGVDYAKMIYAYANDQPYNYPDQYLTGIKWRNPFTDIVFTAIAVMNGLISLNTVFKQNKGIIIDAFSYKGDNRPFWAYLYLLVTFFFRR